MGVERGLELREGFLPHVCTGNLKNRVELRPFSEAPERSFRLQGGLLAVVRGLRRSIWTEQDKVQGNSACALQITQLQRSLLLLTGEGLPRGGGGG